MGKLFVVVIVVFVDVAKVETGGICLSCLKDVDGTPALKIRGGNELEVAGGIETVGDVLITTCGSFDD